MSGSISAGTRVLGALGLTLMSTGAFAVPYYWTDWTGSDLDPGAGFQAQGSMTTPTSTIGVTYTNARGVGFYQATGGTDYYTNRGAGTSPYESTLVDNRPTGTDIIALQYAGSQTPSFTEAIANPVFAFVSLNFNGYGFDQDFEILSVGGEGGNACGYWGCGGITKSIVDLGGGRFEYQLNASNVGGSEPHGTIRFLGAFSTLTWRSQSNEYWNGFTVGVQGTAAEVPPCDIDPTGEGCNNPPPPPPPTSVPEPGTLALFGLGLLGLGLTRRRLL